MLRNFIVDDDLLPFDPLIEEFQRTSQLDYSLQITQAFNKLLDDLRNRGMDVRRFGTPLDCLRLKTETAKQSRLTYKTITTSTTYPSIEAKTGFRRLVLNVTAITGGTLTATLQGSDDLDANDSTEPGSSTWETITHLDATTAVESSIVFQREYKWYRVTTTYAGTTVTFNASVHEVGHEDQIIHYALFIIYRSLVKETNDRWQALADMHLQDYTQGLNSMKLTEDSDEDQLVDDDDVQKSGQARMGR
jgi:hypothetical protein